MIKCSLTNSDQQSKPRSCENMSGDDWACSTSLKPYGDASHCWLYQDEQHSSSAVGKHLCLSRCTERMVERHHVSHRSCTARQVGVEQPKSSPRVMSACRWSSQLALKRPQACGCLGMKRVKPEGAFQEKPRIALAVFFPFWWVFNLALAVSCSGHLMVCWFPLQAPEKGHS